jgi:DNA-binding MarR family transcriptional regulator
VNERRRPSVLFDLYVASQLTGQLLEIELEGSDVPVEDFALYNALVHFGEVTPTRLARHLGMPLSTLLFRFGRIEERGHAVRERNPRDGRSLLLRLSDAGLLAHERAKPPFTAAAEGVSRQLTLQRDVVRDAVADLARAVGAALDEARDRRLVEKRRAS